MDLLWVSTLTLKAARLPVCPESESRVTSQWGSSHGPTGRWQDEGVQIFLGINMENPWVDYDWHGHDSGTDWLEVPTMYKGLYKAYVREYPHKIWPYMEVKTWVCLVGDFLFSQWSIHQKWGIDEVNIYIYIFFWGPLKLSKSKLLLTWLNQVKNQIFSLEIGLW